MRSPAADTCDRLRRWHDWRSANAAARAQTSSPVSPSARCTTSPSLDTQRIVGSARMRKRVASAAFAALSSVSIFSTRSRPRSVTDTRSSCGPSTLHGPQRCAQKAMIFGPEVSATAACRARARRGRQRARWRRVARAPSTCRSKHKAPAAERRTQLATGRGARAPHARAHALLAAEAWTGHGPRARSSRRTRRASPQ